MNDDRKARPALHEPATRAPERPRWQPRFGLGTMMLVMLVCGVMSSAGYYLVRGNLARPGDGGASGSHLQLAFILITLASPLLVAVAISLFLQITRYVSRRRPPHRSPKELE